MGNYYNHGLEHLEGKSTLSIRRKAEGVIHIEVKDEFEPNVTFLLSKYDVKKLSEYLIETLDPDQS